MKVKVGRGQPSTSLHTRPCETHNGGNCRDPLGEGAPQHRRVLQHRRHGHRRPPRLRRSVGNNAFVQRLFGIFFLSHFHTREQRAHDSPRVTSDRHTPLFRTAPETPPPLTNAPSHMHPRVGADMFSTFKDAEAESATVRFVAHEISSCLFLPPFYFRLQPLTTTTTRLSRHTLLSRRYRSSPRRTSGRWAARCTSLSATPDSTAAGSCK